jgi:hypothetical protein
MFLGLSIELFEYEAAVRAKTSPIDIFYPSFPATFSPAVNV